MRRKLWLALAATAALASAQDTPIDTAQSSITIHVGKAGLLSAAGHEHWVNAPISSGTIRESGDLHVAFSVDAASMTVKPDPKIDPKTEAQIQKDMEDLTLDTRDYPRITFESQRIEASGDGWSVQGTLTLHGVSKTISLAVKKSGNAYVCHTTLKQTQFGIKPVSVGGGAVRVKDEIELDIRIVPAA